MKEANDNILKVLTSTVQESVDFLEKFLHEMDKKFILLRPYSKCFSNLSAETGQCDFLWENSEKLEQNYIKQFVNHIFYLETFFLH
jgi:hypothetical protein